MWQETGSSGRRGEEKRGQREVVRSAAGVVLDAWRGAEAGARQLACGEDRRRGKTSDDGGTSVSEEEGRRRAGMDGFAIFQISRG